MKKIFTILSVTAALLLSACDDDSTSATSEGLQESSNSSSSSYISTSAPSSEKSPTENTAADKSWRDECLEVINKFRATQNLTPLTLADDSKQKCADQQSAADLASGKAHGHFGDCDEFAQNSAPNVSLSRYADEKAIAEHYLEMMWNEKKLIDSGERDPENDADYGYIGHYLNMSRTYYKSVACGFAKSSDGSTGWMNINFY